MVDVDGVGGGSDGRMTHAKIKQNTKKYYHEVILQLHVALRAFFN